MESGPKVEAKQAYVVVRHVKFGPLKKGPGKKKLLEMLNDNTSTESPENDQSLDESDSETEDTGPKDTAESDSPDDFDQDRMIKFAPETSNRYAARQTNASVPGSENRYATRPTSAAGERRFEPESQSQTQNPGGNRQFDSNRRVPGQPASGYGMFGAPKPNNDPQRENGPAQVNRYQKGPSSQPPPSDYRGGRGDFSREKPNMNPNGIRERQAGFRR